MATDVRDLKRRISPKLLRIPGVSGVGLPRGRLTVYLTEDSDKVRREVDQVVQAAAGTGLPCDYVVTGAFRAH
jgi:hypothetical protein